MRPVKGTWDTARHSSHVLAISKHDTEKGAHPVWFCSESPALAQEGGAVTSFSFHLGPSPGGERARRDPPPATIPDVAGLLLLCQPPWACARRPGAGQEGRDCPQTPLPTPTRSRSREQWGRSRRYIPDRGPNCATTLLGVLLSGAEGVAGVLGKATPRLRVKLGQGLRAPAPTLC